MQPRLFIFITLIVVLLAACSAPAQPTALPTETSTTTPSPSPEPTLTSTPLPTATETPKVDKWQTTMDGLITYKDGDLLGGEFIINPEKTEEVWTQFFTGLYKFNVEPALTRDVVAKNKTGDETYPLARKFYNRYPTLEAFLAAARNGEPLYDLQGFVASSGGGENAFFTKQQTSWNPLEMVNTDGTVTYPEVVYGSSLRVVVPEVSLSDLRTNADVVAREQGFTVFDTYNRGMARVELIEVEGKPIFQLTLMRWIGRDDKSDGYNTLTLLDTDPPDKKLQSVNLLLRSYLFEFMIIGENDPGDVDRGTAWVVDYSPREEPVLKTREHGIDAELNNLMLDVTDPLIIPK